MPQGEKIVYHNKYGYIAENKLARKLIRRDVNILSLTALCLFIVSIIFGAFIGVLFMNIGIYNNGFGLSTELYYAMSGALVVLGTGLPFALYLVIKQQNLSSFLRFEKVGAANGLLFILAGAGLCLLANFPVQWLGNIIEGFGFSSGQQSMPAATTPGAMVLYFLSVAILPAVFEEFAFRGVLLSSLRKYGDVFALIISSVIFGLLHMSVTAIPFAIASGLVMGYVYMRTGNLWINIGIHFLNNAIAVIMDILVANLPQGAGDIATNIIFFGFIVAGLAALAVLFGRKMVQTEIKKPEIASGFNDRVLAAVTNPGMIIFAAVCLFYAVIEMLGIGIS